MKCIPASIAFGHPNTDLSGIFLKPIRDWDYPNKLPFVPKRRCLLVHNSANPDDDLVYSYVYDNLGNITAVSIYGILIESYEYDSLGQLIRENNVFEDYTKLYEYDKAGNIRYTSVMPYTSATSANIAFAEGSILSYGYSTSSWGDLLTNFNGTAINYDAIGNPTKWRNSSSMSWDARRLTNQRMNNSDWLTYTYNADGIRTQKYFFNDVEMYGTTHDYVLDGTNIIRETVTGDGNNYTLYYLYDTSGSVQGFIYNNNYYYYQKNLQGDVIRILNSSGTVVVEYTYDAWGKVLSVTGSQASTIGQYNPFRYRGYYYDAETGFYYVSSRYYDPEIGRWINADGYVSTGQGVLGNNMFAYCGNNPVNRKDPTGQFWITALIVTAVAVVCTFALSSCSTQPTSDVGAASPYSPSNSTDYNCYAYALGEKTWKYVGGSPDAVKDFDVDNVAEMVLLDAKKDGRSMRTIDSYDSPIESNEYRIALRTGKEDYHFMVQHNDGSWSHKPGFCSTRLIDGANPSVISWDAPRVDAALLYNFGIVKEIGSVPNYYDSRTIYFAVSK